MAQEILVKDALTDRMVTAGQIFTDALVQSGWPFVAVFWFYDWESNRWRLVVASSKAEKNITESLGELYAILESSEAALTFFTLRLLPPDNQYVQEILGITRNGYMPRDRAIRGPLVEDSYVYVVNHTGSR